MQALLDTIQRERAGHDPMASRAIAPSCSTTIDAHQRGRASYRVLSRGHHVHVVNNQPDKGFVIVTFPSGLLLAFLPVDWRGLRSASFSRISHWSRFSSVAVTNRGVSSFSRALPRVHSHDLTGANRSVVHSATRQHFSQAVADVVHLYRLSYSPSFDGSKKPWKWRQELGKVIQGRGHFVQGGGRCD